MATAENDESVLLETPVVAALHIGSERLRLFFTDRRIIVAHIGKRGVAAPGLGPFFGSLSGAVEDLVKGGRESVTKRKTKESVPDRLLAGDKDNFFISYTDIVSAVFDSAHVRPKLMVLTRDDKFQFTVMERSEQLLDLLQRVLQKRLSLT